MMSYEKERFNKLLDYTLENGAYFCDGDLLTKENLKIGTFYEGNFNNTELNSSSGYQL